MKRVRKRYLLVLAVLLSLLYWSYQTYGIEWGRIGLIIHITAGLLFVFLLAEQY